MTVKLRNDLDGVVFIGGVAYGAGDKVPDGVAVGGHLTADGKDHGFPEPAAAPVPDDVDPLTDDETAQAEALGVPTDVHPERVRGALLGYSQGRQDVLTAAAVGSEFDPEGHTVEEVLAHLDENPDDAVTVAVLEARGKHRTGILDRFVV